MLRVTQFIHFVSLDGVDWNDPDKEKKVYVGKAILDFVDRTKDISQRAPTGKKGYRSPRGKIRRSQDERSKSHRGPEAAGRRRNARHHKQCLRLLAPPCERFHIRQCKSLRRNLVSGHWKRSAGSSY